ncbi:MAG: hypothetical protein H3C47_11715 [Candidatus Cloacimonetes bacterium]|nr:hypothetical protein [Candidatus Cloacimonadota bacterium]
MDDMKASIYRSQYNPAEWDERFGVVLSDSGSIDWENDSLHFLTDMQATVLAPTTPNLATGESIPPVSLNTSLEMDPYGVPLVDLPPSMAKTLFAFQGRPHTLAGIYDFRARAYDSCTGRFLQPDPMQDGSNWLMFTGGKPTMATDPTGFFEFVNAEPEWIDQPGYPYPRRVRNTSDAYFTAKALVNRYQSEQNFLINEIENNPFGRLDNCSPEQQNILDELLKRFKSNRKVSVYGQRDILSILNNSQGRTTPFGIQLFPAAEVGGNQEVQVLFHEAVHVLQYDGLFPREFTEKHPEHGQVDAIRFNKIQPGPKAYEQQIWFFSRKQNR